MRFKDKILYAGKYYSEIDITIFDSNGQICLKRYDGVLLFHKDKDQFLIANQRGIIEDDILYCYSASRIIYINNPFSLKDLWAVNGLIKDQRANDYLSAIIHNNGFGDYQVFPTREKVQKNSHWNSICKDCGAPAYINLFSIECSNNCKGEKK